MFYLFIIHSFFFFHFLFHLNLIKHCIPEFFNKQKPCHCIWFCMLLLYFGTHTYLFSPDEGSCYVFLTIVASLLHLMVLLLIVLFNQTMILPTKYILLACLLKHKACKWIIHSQIYVFSRTWHWHWGIYINIMLS